MSSEVTSDYQKGDVVVLTHLIRNKAGNSVGAGRLAKVTSIDENGKWIEIYITSNCYLIRGYARVTVNDIKLFQR
jgi:hypothetical protein